MKITEYFSWGNRTVKNLILILFLSMTMLSGGFVLLLQNQPSIPHHLVSKVSTVGLQISSQGSSTLYENISWVNWGVGYSWAPYGGVERPQGILCATLLQDGKTVVAGEAHRTVAWNSLTGQVVKVLGLSKEGTLCACCLAGDSLFATATGSVISIWNAHSLMLQDTIGELDVVDEMGFSSDGKHMLTITGSGTFGRNLRLWNYRRKQVIKDFRTQFQTVFSACFSPDGRSILLANSGEFDGPDPGSYSVCLWEIATGKFLQRQNDIQQPTRVCFSPDGRFIAAGFEYVEQKWAEDNDTTLRIWDATSGNCLLAARDYTTGVAHLVFSPSSSSIASVAGDGFLTIRTVGSHEKTVLRRDDIKVQKPLAFSPNGQLLISGASNTRAIIWNVERGETIRVLDPKHRIGHRAMIWAVAYSRDGTMVASGDNRDSLMLWRASDGKRLRSIGSGTVSDLSFSPDGKLIASSYFRSQVVKLWNTASGRSVSEFRGHKDGVTGCGLSSDGHFLVSGSKDGDVRLWDVASTKCIRVYHKKPPPNSTYVNSVESVAFGPHDSTIFAGYYGYVCIWNTWAGTIARTLVDSGGYPIAWGHSSERLIPSSSGRFLVSFGQDGGHNMSRVWDLTSGKVMWRFETGQYYKAAALSPDDRFIVTGGTDEVTRIWDWRLGKQVFEFTDYRDMPQGLAWSPDGKYVISGTTDGTLMMWKVPRSIN